MPAGNGLAHHFKHTSSPIIEMRNTRDIYDSAAASNRNASPHASRVHCRRYMMQHRYCAVIAAASVSRYFVDTLISLFDVAYAAKSRRTISCRRDAEMRAMQHGPTCFFIYAKVAVATSRHEEEARWLSGGARVAGHRDDEAWPSPARCRQGQKRLC